jgi:hypothetical protein
MKSLILISILIILFFSNCDKLTLTEPKTAIIYGRVLYPDQVTGIPGIKVEVQASNNNQNQTYGDITDAFGNYQIELNSLTGYIRIEVISSDFTNVSKQIVYKNVNREYNFVLGKTILTPLIRILGNDYFELIKYNFDDLHLKDIYQVKALTANFYHNGSYSPRICIIPADITWSSLNTGVLNKNYLMNTLTTIYSVDNSATLDITSSSLYSILSCQNGIGLYFSQSGWSGGYSFSPNGSGPDYSFSVTYSDDFNK